VQKINSNSVKVNSRILQGLQKWRIHVYTAHIAALVLGVVAATLGIVIGPAVQVLIAPDTGTLLWSDILGPLWSQWLSPFLKREGLSVAKLYAHLPLALLSIATVKAILTVFQWYTWERLGEQLAFDWRHQLVSGFIYVNPSQRDHYDVASVESELGGLMTQDIRTCRDYVVHFFGGLPREGLQALFMAISVAVLSPKLFFIFAICLAPIVLFLNKLGKKIRRRTSQALEDNSVLGEWIQQRLLGIETIKQYGTESIEIRAMRKASATLYERFVRATRAKSRTGPLIEILGVFAICVAIGVSFFEIISGRISGAVAMSFFASLALFAQSATKLARYFNSNREGIAAADRIFGAIDKFDCVRLASVRTPESLKRADHTSLTLSSLEVWYGQKVAIHPISQSFTAGKLYCIVGSSGAGKSTLFSAMLGLRQLKNGSIEYCVDGKRDFSSRLDIIYMPQISLVFPGSIAENVAYPEQDIDYERVLDALLAVGLIIDDKGLKDGLRTLVGPGELQFSGGEAQRLQLARLIYHKAPFVLIDEGTSALDPELEHLVLMKARDLVKTGVVVIMIAHRPAATEFADEIIVMRDGEITKTGRRADVVVSSEFREVFG
jgi:ATP-binding cassette, subfamily B, bacterial MsbA